MRAKKFIFRGDVTSCSGIANAVAVANSSVSIWLRDVQEMSDVTDLIAEHVAKTEHRRASWRFRDKIMSATEIAAEISVCAQTVREWLKDTEFGATVDEIISTHMCSKWSAKCYIYAGNICTITDISKRVNRSWYVIQTIIESTNAPEKSDVTDLVDTALVGKVRRVRTSKFFIYHGQRLSMANIARESGLDPRRVSYLLKNSRSGDVIDSIVDNNARCRGNRYLYRGELLTMPEISIKSGKRLGSVKNKLHGATPNTDVTHIVECIRTGCKTFLFCGKNMSCAEIAKELGASVSSVRHTLKDVESDVDVASLFKSGRYGKKTVIMPDGSVVQRHKLSVFLNVENTKVEIESREYLASKNYNERLKLGFDKSSRSTWIIDDLWEYECPVCHNKLLLTTDEIIKHEHGSICEEAAII